MRSGWSESLNICHAPTSPLNPHSRPRPSRSPPPPQPPQLPTPPPPPLSRRWWCSGGGVQRGLRKSLSASGGARTRRTRTRDLLSREPRAWEGRTGRRPPREAVCVCVYVCVFGRARVSGWEGGADLHGLDVALRALNVHVDAAPRRRRLEPALQVVAESPPSKPSRPRRPPDDQRATRGGAGRRGGGGHLKSGLWPKRHASSRISRYTFCRRPRTPPTSLTR